MIGKSNIPLREDIDTPRFKNLISDLTTGGIQSLLSSYIDGQNSSLSGLLKISLENKKYVSLSKLTIKHPKLIGKKIYVYEGYHLVGFANSLFENDKNLEKLFLENACQEQGRDTYLIGIKNPNKNSISQRRINSFFNALTQTFNTSTFDVLLCLYRYCYDNYLPLRIFNSNRDELKHAIDEMQTYRDFYVQAKKQGKTSSDIEQELSSSTLKINYYLPTIIEGNPLYFGNRSIEKLVGRETEQNELLGFLNSDKQFSWFQIAGKAGQGKSRLALELCISAIKMEWEAGFLETAKENKFKSVLETWQPKRNFLFIVDYALPNSDYLKTLLRAFCTRAKELRFKVRLLILERQPWNEGVKDYVNVGDMQVSSGFYAEWFLNLTDRYDGNDFYIHRNRHRSGVLKLPTLSDKSLIEIVRQFSGESIRLTDREILERLHYVDSDRSALFAYIIAAELSENQSVQNLTRERILDKVLFRERNAWWKTIENFSVPRLGDDGDILKLSLYSTIVGGLSIKDLEEVSKELGIKNPSRNKVLSLIKSFNVSGKSPIPDRIPPLKPEIIGEWFVASFIKESPKLMNILPVAWDKHPERVLAFYLRLIDDFPNEYVTSVFIDNIDEKSLSDKVLVKLTLNLIFSIYIINDGVKDKTLSYPSKLQDCSKEVISRDLADDIATLGVCYEYGIFFDVDLKKAIKCYKHASKCGSSLSYYYLAKCRGKGFYIGLKYFLTRTNTMYEIAAKKGCGLAYIWLGDHFSNNLDFDANSRKSYANTEAQYLPEKAFSCYFKAFKMGTPAAAKKLSDCFYSAIGVKKNFLTSKYYHYLYLNEFGLNKDNLSEKINNSLNINFSNKRDWKDFPYDFHPQIIETKVSKNVFFFRNLSVEIPKQEDLEWAKNFVSSKTEITQDPPEVKNHDRLYLDEDPEKYILSLFRASFRINGNDNILNNLNMIDLSIFNLSFKEGMSLILLRAIDKNDKKTKLIPAVFSEIGLFPLPDVPGVFETVLSETDLKPRKIRTGRQKYYLNFYIEFDYSFYINYQFVSSYNEIERYVDSKEDTKKIKELLTPLRYFSGRFFNNLGEKYKATAIFQSSLYILTLVVFPNGSVKIENKTLITELRGVKRRKVDGNLRYEEV